MIVKNLILRNFRNYDYAKVEFDPKLNVIVGENAAGKTNLVEAIYFLSLARSFRTSETADLIGMWVLMRSFSILINHFCGRTYIAIGKPQISTLITLLYTAVLIPLIIIASNYGLRILFLLHTLSFLWLVTINLITIYILIKLSPLKILGNIIPELIGCGIMFAITYSLSTVNCTSLFQVISMIICLAVYIGFLFTIRSERMIIKKIWQHTAKSVVTRIKGRE